MPSRKLELAAVDFAQAIGLLVRRVRAASATQELSWTETSVLHRLGKDGPTTTADLARAQGMRPQSMRTIVASLEKLGMLARKPHATDGRQINLHLTPKGAAVQKSAVNAKQTWIVQAMASLSEQDRSTLFAAGHIIRTLVDHEQ